RTEGFRVKTKVRQQLANRKRRLARRLDTTNVPDCRRPMFTARDIHYEIADRTRGISSGGIGALHALARHVGLIAALHRDPHLPASPPPSQGAAPGPPFPKTARCEGTGLQDLDPRRTDEVFLDALGAQRIPDPTTAGDFCRRFDEAALRQLQDSVHDVRVGVWA